MENLEVLLVPGLWFSEHGPTAENLTALGFSILNIHSLPTQKERVAVLLAHLEAHPRATTLVGHSAGCITILEGLKALELGRIKRVILMNSGPLPGTRFSIFDPIFWIIPRYIWKMLSCKQFAPSPKDAANLFSAYGSGEIDDLMKDIQPDSSRFLLNIVFRQWRPSMTLDFSGVAEVFVVNSGNDRTLGTTAPTTARLLVCAAVKYSTAYTVAELRLGYGHMATLGQLPRILEIVQGL